MVNQVECENHTLGLQSIEKGTDP